MIRANLALALMLFGLIYWDLSLQDREAQQRDPTDRVGRLIDPGDRERMTGAAAIIVRQGPRAFPYGRVDGIWRYLGEECRNAIVRQRDLETLQQKLFEAEGVLVPVDAASESQLGFDPQRLVRISFHGPGFLQQDDRDERIGIELGLPTASGRSCFARRPGKRVTWTIDSNPHAELVRPGPAWPPLIDRALIPGLWPGDAGRVEQVEARVGDELVLAIQLVRVELTEEEMREGKSPFAWWLSPKVTAASGELTEGPPDTPANERLALAYLRYLFRVPYAGLVPPTAADPPHAGNARAVVTLTPTDGDPLHLFIGGPAPDGGRLVFNPQTQLLHRVDEALIDLLTPDATALLGDDQAPDPWSAALNPQ